MSAWKSQNTKPPTGSTVIDEETTSRDEELKRLLNVSRQEEDLLWKILDGLGCQKIPDDLEYVEGSDLEETSLSKILQRKILQIQKFVQLGGSLSAVETLKELKQAMEEKEAAKDEHGICPKSSLFADRAKSTQDDEIVNLNVGGNTFTTSRKTLCRVPGSMLESMFTRFGENPARQTQDGTYVIDRDGSHFAHILNYLRVGAVVSLPEGRAARDALAMEADYYGLVDLVGAIRMPMIDVTRYLPDKVVDIWSEEEKIRAAFVKDGGKNLDPHEGLVSVFGGDIRHPLRYTPVTGSEVFPTVMDIRQGYLTENQPVAVLRLDEFLTNFNKEHANVLHRLGGVLQDEPVIIAGGSVLRALTVREGLRPEEWWESGKSDIDIFIHSSTPDEATRITQRIFYALSSRDSECWVIIRGRGVVTIHSWEPAPHGWGHVLGNKIQVVLRLYDSPAEVLYGFDVDCCACAYAHEKVWATQRCIHAIQTGVNILNPIHVWPNRPSYEIRLAKYANRGYAVAVPALDMRRVDDQRIRTTSLHNTHGLSRLIKIVYAVESDCLAKDPCDPIRNPGLKENAKTVMSECEQLINGYYQDDDVEGPIQGIIVPKIYGYGEDMPVSALNWREGFDDQEEAFPLAGESRDAAWNSILNAEESPVVGLPDKLDDAWSTEKESREYLNATMNKADLDSLYYDHAFEKTS
eukprot:scaffold561_cov162-Amphora_coffeaeformis.AAC.7